MIKIVFNFVGDSMKVLLLIFLLTSACTTVEENQEKKINFNNIKEASKQDQEPSNDMTQEAGVFTKKSCDDIIKSYQDRIVNNGGNPVINKLGFAFVMSSSDIEDRSFLLLILSGLTDVQKLEERKLIATQCFEDGEYYDVFFDRP